MIQRPRKNKFYVLVANYRPEKPSQPSKYRRSKPVHIIVQNRGLVHRSDGVHYQVVLVKYVGFKPDEWTNIRNKESGKFGEPILAPKNLIIGWEHTNQDEAEALAMAEVL